MLAPWFNLLPLFVVRWAARRWCQTVAQGGAVLRCGTKDVYFYERAAATKEPQQ